MYNQLYNLEEADKPILVIVGNIPPKWRWMKGKGGKRWKRSLTYEEKMRKYNTIRKNIVVAYCSFNTQVFHALDERDFVEYLVDLHDKAEKKGTRLRPIPKKSKGARNIKVDVYSRFPLIGKKMANKLAKEYKIKEFVNLSKEELMEISGIGPKTASKIKEIISK